MWMKQRQVSVEPWQNDEEDDEDDELLETGVAGGSGLMGAKYGADRVDSGAGVVVAPSDKTKKNEVKSKFKELLAKNNKNKCTYEQVHALYRTQKKQAKLPTAPSSSDEGQLPTKKPPVPRFTRDNFFISKPSVPMIQQFYEKHITDDDVIQKGLEEGKFLEGRLFFDKAIGNKWDGFVKVKGVEQAVKVRGLRYLNRALHLDHVVVKLCDWAIWEPAQAKFIKNIAFEEGGSIDSKIDESTPAKPQ